MKLFSEFIKQDTVDNIFCEVFTLCDMLSTDIYSIDESLALFSGQIPILLQLTKHTYHEIKLKHYGFNLTFIDKDFGDDMFFKKICIKDSDNDNILGGYENKTKFDDNEKQIEEIKICLNAKKVTSYEETMSLIAHELKHAWQDYQAYINKSDLTQYVLSNSRKYKITSKSSSILCNIIYRCFKHETDAFMSEFAIEVSDQIKKNKPNSLQDCIRLFKETSVYNDFALSLKILNEYKISDELKTEFVNDINKELNTNYTWNEFKNKYNKPLNKAFQKLCNVGANMFWAYVESMRRQISNNKVNEMQENGIQIRVDNRNMFKKLNEILYN